jgi:hypothetical protein
MWNKMMSVDDHFFCERPRPAANIDIVRCLATFEEARDMRAAFDRLARAFGRGSVVSGGGGGATASATGGFVKFKNGMAWGEEEAQSRFHLRIVLATVSFTDPARPTAGALRSDPDTRRLWDDYLSTQPVPDSVGREMWRRQVRREC